MYVGFKMHQDYEESVDLNLPVSRFTEYVDNEWKKSYQTRDPKKYNINFKFLAQNEIPEDVLNPNLQDSNLSNSNRDQNNSDSSESEDMKMDR
jgi:poly(A) polymerase Pap1